MAEAEHVDDKDRLTLRLPADTRHLQVARRFVSDAVTPWGPLSLDEVELMTSEIVGNAIIHAKSPVTIRVTRAGAFGRVEVHDQNDQLPKRQPVDPDRLGGNGLIILDAIATSWGSIPTADRGKVVWFEFPIAHSR